MREERTEHVCNGSDHAFGMAVLLRGVGTSIAREDAVEGEELAELGVLKFAAIVGLKNFN